MNKSSRLILFILITVFLLFLGLVFAPWVVPNLVLPAALAVWLLLRLFVLSIDQNIYWWILTAAAALWAVYRLLNSGEQTSQGEQGPPRDALILWKKWKTLLVFWKSESSEYNRVRQELIFLVTSLYASKQHGANQQEIRSALENRDLPLPDPLYTFLFPPEPVKPARPSLKTTLQGITHGWQEWYRNVTGQDRAEFNRMVNNLIEFMENSLESEHES